MTIIGFDVSKYELVGVCITKGGAVRDQYIIPNTPEAITSFLEQVQTAHSNLLIAAEATAAYYWELALECVSRDIPFKLINPLLTKQFTYRTVRKKKTDLADATIIARLALQGEGTLLGSDHFTGLKQLSRTRAKFASFSRRLSQMEKHIQHILPHATMIQRQCSLPRKTLEETSAILQQEVTQRIDPVTQKLLSTIPGVGPVISSILIAEIGDISKFSSSKSLVAFAGLDPKVRQSGTSLHRNTRLTKRGSPFLRHALYVAASVGQRHDPELKVYDDKKRHEGKRYKEATIANARHILYRAYAVWTRGTPYVPRPLP